MLRAADGADQLAETARGRRDRVEALRIERDRLGRLDRGLPGRKLEPACSSRAAECVVDVRLAPRRTEHGLEHAERALAAVGDRQLVDIRPLA